MVLKTAQDLDSAERGNMTDNVSDFSVARKSTDGATDQKETKWTNHNFSQYLGYFKAVPELKSTILTKAKYVIGKGLKASKEDKEILDRWRGWGKDPGANQIIKNLVAVAYVGGDGFAEIIRDDSVFRKIFTWFKIIKPKKPVNLKPLDPETISIIVNPQGMILRYEQNSKTGAKTPPIIIKPENMFHLTKDRFADEIHGTSIIAAIENIILSRGEAMDDMKTVFHRYVKPLWVWNLKTDNATKIANFKAKADKAVDKGENLYIPFGSAVAERISVPQFSTLDPLPWIRDLTDYFYQATNTPDVVVGSAKQTVEASAKILILGFEQSVRDDQLWVMENFKAQLGLEIELEYPTPIEADLIKDNSKDGKSNFKKSDTRTGIKGKK